MQAEQKQENVMKKISIEKINLNYGAGEPGENLEKGKKLLNKISGMKIITTKAKKRIPTWGLRPNLEIACKVTIRGKKAEELMKMLLTGKKNTLKESCFDNKGNFSFGINEYLDIEGLEYDADIGIVGFEVAVTLQRKGYRIRRRQLKRKSIPKSHQIQKEEAIEFMKGIYGVKIE